MKLAVFLQALLAFVSITCAGAPAEQPTAADTPGITPTPTVTSGPSPTPRPAVTPTPTPTQEAEAIPSPPRTPIPIGHMTAPRLRYLLFDEFDILFCPPFPLWVGNEYLQQLAGRAFPSIRENQELFNAVTSRLKISAGSTISDREKLDIYREVRKLHWVQLEREGDGFAFGFAARDDGKSVVVSGTINHQGQYTVERKERGGVGCPR